MTAYRAWLWRGFYERLGRYTQRKGADFFAMNFGYHDGRVLVSEHEVERFPLQLYARVVDGVPIEGKDVVDVSCGRGGGLAWITQQRVPRSTRGLDLTPVNIQLCTAQWSRLPMSFSVGSATEVPLASQTADAVLSVEASHCYPDLSAFLRESARVLRKDGVLCWTDFEKVTRSEARRALSTQYFGQLDEVDITEHVMNAMNLDRERRRALIRNHTSRAWWGMLDHFAGSSTEADTFTRFRDGRSRYFLCRLRQPKQGVHE
jgi:2-polyprenyl-3-methyl-5-hydroxy-6-metoxy-1,4-benzoquinol methylase